MELSDFLRAVVRGEYDSELERINATLVQRSEIVRRANNLELLSQLQPGDTVWFTDKTKPKYLAGLKATVKGVRGDKVVVNVAPEDRIFARRYTHDITCPPAFYE